MCCFLGEDRCVSTGRKSELCVLEAQRRKSALSSLLLGLPFGGKTALLLLHLTSVDQEISLA